MARYPAKSAGAYGGKVAGRKPKPTAVKRAEGNPGKRPLNENEPQPASGKPKAPAHLSSVAKAHWHATMRVLFPTGVITLAERDLLTVYCEAWAMKRQAMEEIRPKVGKEGHRSGGLTVTNAAGNTVRNPLLAVVAECNKVILRCQSELGLTPSARARLSVGEKVGDALDKFLNGDE